MRRTSDGETTFDEAAVARIFPPRSGAPAVTLGVLGEACLGAAPGEGAAGSVAPPIRSGFFGTRERARKAR